MAGGIGSRFWPESTKDRPKQFLDILGVGKSLLRMTFERFEKLVPVERIFIMTNQLYKGQVMEHLPEIPERNILLEPSRNNTAPAVAYATMRLLAENPNVVFVTAPSDHVILKEDHFLQLIQKALSFAEKNDKIVTLGIEPTRPDTGYGYIEIENGQSIDGVEKVKAFKEKPEFSTAEDYLQSGNYLWNAGIFIWSGQHLKRSFEKNAPEIIEVLSEEESLFGSPREQSYIDRVYPSTPNISVDYAILERSSNVFTIPADIGWSDLGTWNSLHSYVQKDENENVLQGNIDAGQVTNSLIRTSKGKRVIIKGLDNYIVVENEDALLIYPKSDEQEIKEKVEG